MDEFMSGAFDSSSSESDRKVKPAVKKTSKPKKMKYVHVFVIFFLFCFGD